MSSKSLGTLTLDLVARVGGFVQGMDKAERSSAKWRKQVEKDMRTVGTVAGAGIAAVVAGTTAMVVSTTRAASEISRFSALSGTTEEIFQRQAAGAKAVGIEQDKLADIFKDTQDKVGDFLQTGGGPLKDFFENIAPQVGVTAEQFRKLSGPDALQLYVSSLEKAGVGQSDMVFYMEALASDATLLLPLLKNNGLAMGELGDAAAAAGAIMDEKTLRAANELAAAAIVAEQGMLGLKNQMMSGLMPVLSDLAGELLETSINTDVAAEAGETLGGVMKGLAVSTFAAYTAFQVVGRGYAALLNAKKAADIGYGDLILGPIGVGRKIYKNFDATKNALDVGIDDIKGRVEEYAQVFDRLLDAGSGAAGGDQKNRAKQIADLIREAYEQMNAAAGGKGGKPAIDEKAAKAAQKTADAIAGQVAQLQLQSATLGMTSAEADIYRLRLEGATDAQLKSAQAALDSIDAYEEQQEAFREQQELFAAVDALKRESQTDEVRRVEELQEKYRTLNDAILQGVISQQEAAEIAAGLAEQFAESDDNGDYWERWLESAETALTSFDELAASVIENFSGQFGDAFEAMIFDSENLGDAITGMAENMARSVINALGQMIAQWIAYNAVAGLTGGAGGGVAVSGGGIFSALTGMAHDGIDMVPQTGTWLLKKGERVTTAETSAKLDGTLEEIRHGRLRASNDGGGRPVVQQTIQVAGRVDGRTATQIATETARSQRRAQGRLG